MEKTDQPKEEPKEPEKSLKFLKIDRSLRPEGCHFDPEVVFDRPDQDDK